MHYNYPSEKKTVHLIQDTWLTRNNLELAHREEELAAIEARIKELTNHLHYCGLHVSGKFGWNPENRPPESAAAEVSVLNERRTQLLAHIKALRTPMCPLLL